MFDRKLIAVLTCAVIFGLFAALMVSRYLSNVKAQSKTIVAASVPIPMSSQITADQLTLVHLPPEATPDGAYDSIEKLVGRVTVVGIGAKEPLTELKLAPEGSAAGLAAMITEGTRAMTVKVDDVVGVAGFVLKRPPYGAGVGPGSPIARGSKRRSTHKVRGSTCRRSEASADPQATRYVARMGMLSKL